MTGLHIFSLCSGFVFAESSITGMSLLGCLESYFPWCYFSPLMTVSALRSVQPFSRFSVALCTQSLMCMHMLMSIQIQIGAIALLNKEIFFKKLLTPKLKILIYIFMSFWTYVPFFFGSLAVLLNAIKSHKKKTKSTIESTLKDICATIVVPHTFLCKKWKTF